MPLRPHRDQIEISEEWTSAEILEDLRFIAEICEHRPEALGIFDRLERELAEALAREKSDPLTKIRALRAIQREHKKNSQGHPTFN